MKILALSPHTDDIEIGCGGVLARMSNKYAIKVVAFSKALKGPKYQGGTIAIEFKKSMKELHITDTKILNYKSRTLPKYRAEILDYLWNLYQTYNPTIVFTPMRGDIHQDHQTITNEAIRAFKYVTILGYELPWNNQTPTLNTFVSLSKEHLIQKEKAINQYKSQKGRVFVGNGYMKSLAKIRGGMIGEEFAEAFEAIKINLKSLKGIK